ncbi:nucleoside-triphosphatase [Persephonella sp.]
MKILITGRPAVGKTTVVKKLLKKLPYKFIGFYTDEIRDANGKRIGFKIVTTNGYEKILSHKGLKSKYKVGSYGVDVKGFESTVIPLFEKHKKDKEKIFIIDEIGKMELFSDRFVKTIKDLFKERDINIIATIPIKNVHPVLEKIRNMKDV